MIDFYLIILGSVLAGAAIGWLLGWAFGFAKGQEKILEMFDRRDKSILEAEFLEVE